MRALGHAAALSGAIAAVLVVLAPPLSSIGQQLFAAHMLQHLLVVIVAAPLLVVGRAFDLTRQADQVASWMTRPALAWLAFTAVFLFWHWPAAFRWAAQSEPGRIFEHGSLLLAALIFWSVALARGDQRPLSYGGAALFVLTAGVVTDLPGVVMVFAPRAICTMPAENAAAWSLTPLEDQQFAGLLMWVAANLFFFAIAMWLFALWLTDPARDAGAERNVGVS